MENPETHEDAEHLLAELRKRQTELKKTKRVERRKNRAEARKAAKIIT